ncbi:hypothetical protein PBI_SCHIEBS_12 [Gordonia phage Schiebs]|nr:hypothetical protein PBI_SCHIEBS_12 [Gordonia phage Schiebs]
MAEVRIEGGARLRRTLKAAGVDMKELSAINRKAANVVATAARPTAPVRSGALARSVRAGATAKAGVVRAGNKAVPYAGPIHWGWPARGIEPHPWIADAAQATESEWVAQYFEHVEDVLDSVKGR